MARGWPRFLSSMWSIFSYAIISIALILILIRLLLPFMGEYQTEIANWASASLGKKIVITSLAFNWHGVRPVLQLRGVKIALFDESLINANTITLESIDLILDLVASIRELRLVPTELLLIKPQFSIPSSFAANHQPSSFDWLSLWKLGQSRIVVHDAQFCLIFGCLTLNARLNSDGERLQGNVELHLSDQLEESAYLILAAHYKNDWHGEWYLNTRKFALNRLINWLNPKITMNGSAALQIWGTWNQSGLIRVDGSIDKLIFNNQNSQQIVLFIEGFSWIKNLAGWKLDLIMPRRLTAAKSGVIRLIFDGTNQFSLNAINLSLEELSAIASNQGILPPQVINALTTLKPRGQLNNLQLILNTANLAQDNFSVLTLWNNLAIQGDFAELSWQPWRYIPGVSGLTGRITLIDGVANLDLGLKAGKLYFANLFGNQWNIEQLTVTTLIKYEDANWQLQLPKLLIATKDIAVEANGALFIPNTASPRLDLDGRIIRGDASQIATYLPRRIMPPAAVAWLDRSILGGKLNQGTIIFHGQFSDFPFDHGEGIFEVTSHITEGELNYDSDWPSIHALDANLVFRGRAMEILANSGRILNSTLQNTTAQIPNLDQEPPLLKIRGQTFGPLSDIPYLIKNTSLAHKYGQYINTLDAKGETNLTLTLDLYTKPPVKIVNVSGQLNIKEANLNWHDPEIALSAVNGVLGFSKDGVYGQGINTRIFNLPITLDLNTQTIDGRPNTIINVSGKLASSDLQNYLPTNIIKRITGQTIWSARINLPDIPPGGRPVLSINLESDLYGLTVALPAPFNKTAAQKQIFSLETELNDKSYRQLNITYSGLINAILKFDHHNNLIGGEISVGKAIKPFKLADNHDLLKLILDLPEIKLDDWLILVNDLNHNLVQSPPINNFTINGKIANLYIGNHDFHEMEFAITPEKIANFKANEVVGSLHWSHQNLKLALEKLLLTIKDSSDQVAENNLTSFDPRVLPNVQFYCDNLMVKIENQDINLGQLTINTQSNISGVAINEIKLQAPTFVINGHGRWYGDTKNQISTFEVILESDNLGNTLNALNYIGAVEAGNSKIKFNLEWQGSPIDFNVKNLAGNLNLEIAKGRLLQVNPGKTGRIFGLLSLQALPRRLALDFSDVFLKGLTFDQIAGDFQIKQGNAYSDNFKLQGPSAEILINGRTGLINRDYDQTIKITPHIDMRLPLVGALAASTGIGVGLGAAILLGQRLIQPSIDRISQFSYTLTGSWNEPVVEPLNTVNEQQ